MKKILLTLSTAVFTLSAIAQTAPDFTATDCNGTSHNLYTELSGGNVVILNWVMPCGACIAPSQTAYNAAQSFAITNPGKVKYFLLDDNGGTTCSALTSWATTNNILSPTATFDNSGNTVNEMNYGGSGMPHVMVIGPDHTILFNGLNAAANNPNAIYNAITIGLTPASIAQYQPHAFQLSAAPNPTHNTLHLQYVTKEESPIQVSILNAMGQLMMEQKANPRSGQNELPLNVSALAAGQYFIRLVQGNKVEKIPFVRN